MRAEMENLREEMRQFFEGFPRDAHPMAVLSSAVPPRSHPASSARAAAPAATTRAREVCVAT